MNDPVAVTGGAGFAGRYLVNLLAAENRCVHVLDRSPAPVEEPVDARITFHRTDLNEPSGLADLLARINPVEIYHLAGIANVKNSWDGEAHTYVVNVIGEVNLLSALRSTGLKADVLVVSSGEVYGQVPEELQPIRETRPPDPRSPYAASKVCQEIIARQYARQIKGRIIVVRPFNHIGPGQHPSFVTSDFARQISMAERGMIEPVLKVGNLSAYRDFTDVRDMVRGYVMAMRSGQPGQVYNICSGTTYQIRHILNLLLEISSTDIEIVIEPEKFRPADIPILCGSSEQFRRLTGWKPGMRIEETLGEILNDWRNRIDC